MEYINLTPHAIVLNDGRVYEPSGQVARVQASYVEISDDRYRQTFGEVSGLPTPQEGIRYITSAMVLSAVADTGERNDLVAPATGHPDTVRNEKGHIVSVPGFVV